MKVLWLRRAENDLDAACDYLAKRNPRAAWRTYRTIREKVERLADHPGMGRPGRVQGTRELVITGTPYIVPYAAYAPLNAVVALRVLHSLRAWPEHFEDMP